MKYVVSGYIGFDNFGDEAIAHILCDKLKSAGAEKITLISSNPQRTSALHKVDSCGMLNFLPALMEADMLISGGGSLLQDVTSLKSLLYYLFVIYSALILRKKVKIYAQGIGPINSITGKILTKFALKKVSEITVRDIKSKELLAEWGIPSILVKDPVFELELPLNNKKGVVGIQLRKYKGLDERFLENLACEIFKFFPNNHIKLISLQDSIDLEICEKFAKILNSKGVFNVEVLNGLSINDVFETISGLEYLISMRFHADVVGIKTGVKTLAINYDPKISKLAAEYNLPMINLYEKDFSSQFEKLCE